MAQTIIGAQKVAAKRIDISYQEYLEKINNKEKWCSFCKKWHNINLFRKEKSRYDGLSTICFKARKKIHKMRYIHKIRISKKGCRFALPRNNDKKQARHRINHLIEIGIIDKPNNLFCADCGHKYNNDYRHEYHHESYNIDKQEIVIILCTKCHTKRHMNNNTWGRKKNA